MVRGLISGAFGAITVGEHAGELALGHALQGAAHIQAAVNSAVGSGENGTTLVFCGHGASYAGSCPGGGGVSRGDKRLVSINCEGVCERT